MEWLHQLVASFWAWFTATFGAQPDPAVKAWLEYGAAAVGVLGGVGLVYEGVKFIWPLTFGRGRVKRQKDAEAEERAQRKRLEEERDRQLKELREQNTLILDLLKQSNAAQGNVPGQKEAVGEAVTSIAKSAEEGDERMVRALALLKDGKPDEAEPLLRAVAEEKAARAAKDNADAAAAFRHLGAIAGLADPKRAREAYARAVALDPDNIDGLYWSGSLQKDAGNLDAAEKAFRRLLTLKQSDPDNSSVYWARLDLGDIEVARGHLDDALKLYRTAQESAERLAKSDPANAGWQADLAASHGKLGQLNAKMGNKAEALRLFTAGRAIVAPLAEKSGHKLWQGYVQSFDADIAALQ